MTKFRRAAVTAVSSLIVLGLFSAVASASTMTYFQNTSGTITPFDLPPTSSTTVTFDAFNQANADLYVSSVCPSGFHCTGAVLYEIDLGLTAQASGHIQLSNGNETNANLGCISVAGSPCSGSSGNLSNGVGIAGNIHFTGTDPLSTIFNDTGTTFTVATNVRSAGNYSYDLAPGLSDFSGTHTISLPNHDAYDNSDANWLNEALYYSGGTPTITFLLSAGYSDATNPSGVTNPLNSASVTSGAVNATYKFQWDEISDSEAPEPATLFMMGSALIGFGLLRKRIRG